MAGIWKDQYPDFTPIYAPVPAGKGGSISVVGGEDIVLTSASTNQAAALDFIRFTQTEQFQIEMAKTGQMTVIPAFADQQDAIAPYYAAYAEQLKTAKSRLAISSSAKVDAILSTELTPAFKGDVSVQDALTNAAKQIDGLLAAEKIIAMTDLVRSVSSPTLARRLPAGGRCAGREDGWTGFDPILLRRCSSRRACCSTSPSSPIRCCRPW